MLIFINICSVNISVIFVYKIVLGVLNNLEKLSNILFKFILYVDSIEFIVLNYFFNSRLKYLLYFIIYSNLLFFLFINLNCVIFDFIIWGRYVF